MRPAGAGAEHQALPPLRAELRVFLRRSVSGGQDGGQLYPGHPEKWRGRLPQALRRQLPGAAPHGLRFRHGRADAAGDLSHRV